MPETAENCQPDPLTPSQQKALAALLVCPTIEEAAKQGRVGARSLYRWLAEDTVFQSAYRRARREAVEKAIASLQQGADVAVKMLREIAQDKTAPSSSRVAACGKILDYAVKGVELVDFEERLQAIEAAQEARKV